MSLICSCLTFQRNLKKTKPSEKVAEASAIPFISATIHAIRSVYNGCIQGEAHWKIDPSKHHEKSPFFLLVGSTIVNIIDEWARHSWLMLYPQWWCTITMIDLYAYIQWPFQDPRLEVPTIYKAYFLGLCKGISPENMARHMVLTYLHIRILKFPLIYLLTIIVGYQRVSTILVVILEWITWIPWNRWWKIIIFHQFFLIQEGDPQWCLLVYNQH